MTLPERLEAVARRTPVRDRSQVAVAIAPVGQPPILSVNADAELILASTTKLFTTAAALDRLGPQYRFGRRSCRRARSGPTALSPGVSSSGAVATRRSPGASTTTTRGPCSDRGRRPLPPAASSRSATGSRSTPRSSTTSGPTGTGRGRRSSTGGRRRSRRSPTTTTSSSCGSRGHFVPAAGPASVSIRPSRS